MSEYEIREADGLVSICDKKGWICCMDGESIEQDRINAKRIVNGLEHSSRIEQLEKQNKEILEILKELEFPNSYNGYDEGYCCYFCQNTKKQGHADYCKLAKLLKEVSHD